MSEFFIKLKEKLYVIWKYIKKPEKFICDLCDYDNHRFARFIPDKLHLKCLFKKHMNTKLNLSNPKTFSEKLQWLKLYNRNPDYTVMVDKVAVKQYIADKLGSEFIIPTIGVYNSVEEIPFDDLPEKFVIKCTHDSGSLFICDKNSDIDINSIKKDLSKHMQMNHFWYSREWPYKNIKPKIIIEEFISDEKGRSPADYKFFCFNGKMEIFKIDYNRFSNHISNYYSKDLNYLDFHEKTFLSTSDIKLNLPEKFNEMVTVAEKLSEGIPFLRVDLYYTNSKIYFGELTFFPHSGILPYTNNGDLMMGNILDLSKKGGINNE